MRQNPAAKTFRAASKKADKVISKALKPKRKRKKSALSKLFK